MGRNKTNIDILFRDGLENYEMLPPGDVWEGISGAVIPTRRIPLLSVAAAVAFLVVLSAAAISFMDLVENTGLAPKLSASQPAYISDDPQLAFLDNVNRAKTQKKNLFSAKRKRATITSESIVAYNNIRTC